MLSLKEKMATLIKKKHRAGLETDVIVEYFKKYHNDFWEMHAKEDFVDLTEYCMLRELGLSVKEIFQSIEPELLEDKSYKS